MLCEQNIIWYLLGEQRGACIWKYTFVYGLLITDVTQLGQIFGTVLLYVSKALKCFAHRVVFLLYKLKTLHPTIFYL